MEFYCESCETAMCLDCTEGEHREHVTVPLRDVVEQHKAALKTQLDAILSRWGLDKASRIFPSHQVLRSLSIWPRFGICHQRISYAMLCLASPNMGILAEPILVYFLQFYI